MTPPRGIVWATLVGAGTVYEVHELRACRGGTLSEVIRFLVHPETSAGRAVFLLGWGGFAVWFASHIVEDNRRSGLKSTPPVSAIRDLCGTP